MPPRRPHTDLSQQQGNPTSALQEAYSQLMTIQDPDELMQAAISVVEPLVGRGMSQQNYQTFMRNLQNSARRGVQSIQMFLSNYILKGSGLGVSESRALAIASVLTEDVNDFRDMTPEQHRLKNLVESCTGFAVVLL